MYIESPLSIALDSFAGIAAVGTLTSVAIEYVDNGGVPSAKITGRIYWAEQEYSLSIWMGRRQGTPDPEDNPLAWLKIQDLTMDLNNDDVSTAIAAISPEPFIPTLTAAANQLISLLVSATDALSCAITAEDLTAIKQELSRVVNGYKSAIEHEADALIADVDLLFNCSVDLLGAITITEAADPHLSYDVDAVTLDPTTMSKVKIKVGWTRAEGTTFTHTYQIREASCMAHVDSDVERLMTTVPEDSRAHYLHALDHLHQAAHAAAEYSAGKIGQAIAGGGTWDEPLNAIERHEIAHRVHLEVLEEMNPLAWDLSGEPEFPTHEH